MKNNSRGSAFILTLILITMISLLLLAIYSRNSYQVSNSLTLEKRAQLQFLMESGLEDMIYELSYHTQDPFSPSRNWQWFGGSWATSVMGIGVCLRKNDFPAMYISNPEYKGTYEVSFPFRIYDGNALSVTKSILFSPTGNVTFNARVTAWVADDRLGGPFMQVFDSIDVQGAVVYETNWNNPSNNRRVYIFNRVRHWAY